MNPHSVQHIDGKTSDPEGIAEPFSDFNLCQGLEPRSPSLHLKVRVWVSRSGVRTDSCWAEEPESRARLEQGGRFCLIL